MPKNHSQKKANALYVFVRDLTRYFKLNTIVYFPVLLSALILVTGFLLGEQMYKNRAVPDSFIGIVFLIMTLTASFSGFIQIILEEVPGLIVPIQGKAAVFFGILWIAVFWLIGLYIFWNYFF